MKIQNISDIIQETICRKVMLGIRKEYEVNFGIINIIFSVIGIIGAFILINSS